ncbi:VOC family protein [Micromonospora chersina]|uniref:VOC family protein n=1 Tax=Micromonospora chersina TaxID=47854 RepID=UPI003F53FFCE
MSRNPVSTSPTTRPSSTRTAGALPLVFSRFPSASPPRTVCIDIRVAGPGPWDMAERARLIRQKVPELVAAGATVVCEEWYGDVLGHVVMHDPEGNEFCVA